MCTCVCVIVNVTLILPNALQPTWMPSSTHSVSDISIGLSFLSMSPYSVWPLMYCAGFLCVQIHLTTLNLTLIMNSFPSSLKDTHFILLGFWYSCLALLSGFPPSLTQILTLFTRTACSSGILLHEKKSCNKMLPFVNLFLIDLYMCYNRCGV